MKKWQKQLALTVLILFAAACAGDSQPAEEAIKAAEAAIASAKSGAIKYRADQIKDLEDRLKAAKDAFARKNYMAALNAAEDIPDHAKDLAAAVAGEKTGLTKTRGEVSSGLPKMSEASPTGGLGS